MAPAPSSSSQSSKKTVTWPVTEVKVAVGDKVAKDQVLAVAATTDLDAQIAAADRAAKAAALQLSVARTNCADATTTEAIRQTQISVYNAESGVANAKATLADLKKQKALATLKAPAAGVVTAVNVTSGADAPSGTAIALISSDLRITTSVVESDVASISVGQDGDHHRVGDQRDAQRQGRVDRPGGRGYRQQRRRELQR